jgi:hypothetical protein
MEPEASLRCSQKPSTGPYPESDQSNTIRSIPSYLSKIHRMVGTKEIVETLVFRSTGVVLLMLMLELVYRTYFMNG